MSGYFSQKLHSTQEVFASPLLIFSTFTSNQEEIASFTNSSILSKISLSTFSSFEKSNLILSGVILLHLW
ncbi:MAG: hypothetical protein LBD88_02635 [Candidatus Peribacteria bacterium]|jgi:hypothetical protein|nr:hypothetical protein [Candidatus Peribacteria bacterium]